MPEIDNQYQQLREGPEIMRMVSTSQECKHYLKDSTFLKHQEEFEFMKEHELRMQCLST